MDLPRYRCSDKCTSRVQLFSYRNSEVAAFSKAENTSTHNYTNHILAHWHSYYKENNLSGQGKAHNPKWRSLLKFHGAFQLCNLQCKCGCTLSGGEGRGAHKLYSMVLSKYLMQHISSFYRGKPSFCINMPLCSTTIILHSINKCWI